MLMRLIILLYLVLAVHANLDETAPRVKIPLGGLKGYYKISQSGKKYEAYEGIPYAKPPVGKLRFKPPHKIPAWVGELTATKFSSPCIQYSQISQNPKEKVEGAEDCLYLNIYKPLGTKTKENKTLLPVFFWIHGGAFQFGGSNFYHGHYLLDYDIVFVTINYRLGPMGFLSTEDSVVPGNMGLKDQSMALRWVSDNIEWFDGDPKRVILVGLSAGGASVHYHYLSKLSEGLFQGGISISGTALNCWTQTENSLEKAKKLGALMGCPTINTKEMIHCLRHRPAHMIVQAVSEFMTFLYNPFTPFGPVSEKGSDAPFINKSPAEIINSGDIQDVPWITGVVSEEGLYPVAEFITNDQHLKNLNDNWDKLGPQFLDFNYTIPREKHIEIARLIKKHYFGTKLIDRFSLTELVKMASDRFFVVDSEKAARMQANVNQNSVWYYYYTYRAAESLSNFMSNSLNNYGVSHGDDVFLVVGNSYIDPTTKQEDLDMQQVLIDLWLSFAKYGVPNVANVKWLRLDSSMEELHYLHIDDPTKISMTSSFNFGEKKFWNSIQFNENVLQQNFNTKEKIEL